MKDKQRVVVTGFSAMTPAGCGVDRFWNNIVEGVSGIKEITAFTIPENMSNIAGIVEDFESYANWLTDEEKKNLDRSCLFAMAAAEEALEMAQLKQQADEARKMSRFHVHIATAISNIQKMEETLVDWSSESEASLPYVDRPDPQAYQAFQFGTVSKILAKKYGFKGSHSVMATGCTGGVDAIGHAFQTVRQGKADVILTGATEAPITPLVVAAFSKINATTKYTDHPEKASRPFDESRSGFVLAEGCGLLILESLEHALERGATIYGEIMGFGSCNNALHMTDIPGDGESIAKSMQLALQDAACAVEEIDYVNLHGSSTPQNDIAESNAMQLVFGKSGSQIPVTSIKSQIGHALAASNSIELVSTIKTLSTGLIPPTINLDKQDPACQLNVVKQANRSFDVRKIMKISSGFSGIHSSLVLGKYEGEMHA